MFIWGVVWFLGFLANHFLSSPALLSSTWTVLSGLGMVATFLIGARLGRRVRSPLGSRIGLFWLALTGYNELIHQPVRLRIMAALVALGPDDQVEFTYLRDLLNLTDGNLGAHLRKLEEAGYVAITKTCVARKPRTYAAATLAGRQAFAEHVTALEEIIRGGQGQDDYKPVRGKNKT